MPHLRALFAALILTSIVACHRRHAIGIRDRSSGMMVTLCGQLVIATLLVASASASIAKSRKEEAGGGNGRFD
jgi:hypothetical protein